MLSVPEFRAVLRRERNRSERSRLPFSVLIGTVGAASAASHAAQVAVALRQRLRSTDEIGWLDRNRIAAILPYTAAVEASTVLRALIVELKAAAIDLPWEIETYPLPKAGRSAPAPSADASNDVPDRNPPSINGSTRGEAVSGLPAEPSETSIPEDVAGEVPTLPRIMVAPLPTWKRAMDLFGAIVALLLLWPVILIAAIAIKLDSKGPVFYRQRRVGAGGRAFAFYKLRTMQVGAEELKSDLRDHNEQSGPVFKMRSDPRITRVGRLLRRSSIDELPQFWNVLKGDMSLVGPRPPTPDEVVLYEPWQMRRLQVTPGITCLWQVSGRSEVGFVDWVRLDLRYAERRSPGYDLNLLARTLPAVLSGRGAF